MEQNARMVLAAGGMCALATSQDDRPWISLMAYVFEPEGPALLMVTPSASRKTENMRANPRVGLLVDTRRDEAAVREGIMALSAEGEASMLSGEEADQARERILASHPHLEGLASGSTEAVRIELTAHQLLSGPTQVVSRNFQGE